MPSISDRFRTTPARFALRLVAGALIASTLGAACGEVTPPPAVEGVPTALQFQTQPATTTSGVAINPAVEVRVVDANGVTVPDASHTITIAISSGPSGAQLTGTLSASAVNGVASFGNLVLDKASTSYRLSATASGVTSATSATFTVAPGAATQLLFVAAPTSANGGSTIAPPVQVAVADAVGNVVTSATGDVTLALTGGPSGATLSGTTTAALVNGIASFASLSIDKAGTGYAFTASTSGFAAVTSAAFPVNVGPAARLSVTTQPAASVGAGALITVAATLTDLGGNTVTTATNAVTAAITSGTGAAGAVLGGTKTVNASGGVATFSTLTVDKVGTGYTLTLSATGLTSATTNAFNVTVGAAAALRFVTQPSSMTSGTAATWSVEVIDAGGNRVTSATNAVTLSIVPSTGVAGATLGGTLTANAVAGLATFSNITIDKAGSGYQLLASSGTMSIGSSLFAVNPGVATQLAFTTTPASMTSMGHATFAVTVRDAQGNTVTTATNAVTLAIASGTGVSGALLGGTLTRAAVNGVATFSDITVDKAGSGYQFTATATGLNAGTTSALTVNVGAANRLDFVSHPASVVEDATGTYTVRVLDAGGNPVTTATNAITLSIVSGTGTSGAVIGGTLTKAATSGVATFSDITIDRPGTGYVVRASATGLTSAQTSSIEVTAFAVNTNLAFTVQPSGVTAGSAFVPTVEVSIVDDGGSVLTGESATISLAIVSGSGTAGATLLGTTTVATTNGVASFPTLAIDKAGTGYLLIASATGFSDVTSGAFTVAPGAAVSMGFTTAPTSMTAGQAGTFAVTLYDGQGNVATTATTPVTVAIASGTGTAGAILGGTTTVSPSNGVATFSTLTVDKAGTGYQLDASATALAMVTSGAFDVVAGAAAKLTFAAQPPNGSPNAALTPAIQVLVTDALDNPVTTSASVTLALKAGTGASGAVLGGTLTRSTVGGVATFDDITIDRAGVDYQLDASASGLTSASSATFDIGTGVSVGFAQLVVSPASATIAMSETVTLTAVLRDANGNDTPASPVWASSNPGIATVSAAGVVTPLRAGTVTITATQAGLAGRATITITP